MTGDPVLDDLYGPIRPPRRAVHVRLIPWLLGLVVLVACTIGAYSYVSTSATALR
jgi:hypothetical protein